MTLSRTAKVLAIALGVMLILFVLLTPLGLETRSVAGVTSPVWFVFVFGSVVLLGASLVLLSSRMWLASWLARLGVLLFLPPFVADQLGDFNRIAASTRILAVEWAYVLLGALTFALAIRSAWEQCATEGAEACENCGSATGAETSPAIERA